MKQNVGPFKFVITKNSCNQTIFEMLTSFYNFLPSLYIGQVLDWGVTYLIATYHNLKMHKKLHVKYRSLG